MRKKIVNVLFIICLIHFGACNNKTMITFEESKLAPQAVRLIKELNNETNDKKLTPTPAIVKRYGLREENGVFYVGGLVQIMPEFDDTLFTDLEIKQRKNTGSIRTVSIPVLNLGKLSRLPNIKYIEIDQSLTNK